MSVKDKLKYGDQIALARASGVPPQHINGILCKRMKCPGNVAIALEDASREVLGQTISAREWIEAGKLSKLKTLKEFMQGG